MQHPCRFYENSIRSPVPLDSPKRWSKTVLALKRLKKNKKRNKKQPKISAMLKTKHLKSNRVTLKDWVKLKKIQKTTLAILFKVDNDFLHDFFSKMKLKNTNIQNECEQ